MEKPVLYSFRRCPYAMRARLGIMASGLCVELREIVLRDKAPEFLARSETGTVPLLILSDDTVIEESLDILDYALAQSDPEGLLQDTSVEDTLIAQNDGKFKTALDRYKYHTRYEGADAQAERETASDILRGYDATLANQRYLLGDRISRADLAIWPFVRQFANTDRAWFDAQDWPNLIRWLEEFLASDRFAAIMDKYPKWHAGDAPVYFGQEAPTP